MNDIPCMSDDLRTEQPQETRPALPYRRRRILPLKTEHCKPANFNAFTLIEIVLSLGIIAFALVGIMGMLPIALNTARESAQESEATLIAQRIFAEIRNAEDGKALITTSSTDATLQIDLEAPGTYFLAFGPLDTSPTTGAMVPLGTITQGDYNLGLIPSGALEDAQFIARVVVTPADNEPTRVAISIEAPAFATSEIRKRTGNYPFVSLVSP